MCTSEVRTEFVEYIANCVLHIYTIAWTSLQKLVLSVSVSLSLSFSLSLSLSLSLFCVNCVFTLVQLLRINPRGRR